MKIIFILFLLGFIDCGAHPKKIESGQKHPCYGVKYIPLGILFMGYPRAETFKRGGCYRFNTQSHHIERLFSALSPECRIPITADKWKWKYDLRVEITSGNQRIYLTRESEVISGDERYIYVVRRDIVNAAFYDLLRLTSKVKPSYQPCPGPEAPFGCLPCDSSCWAQSKAPHMKPRLPCALPNLPPQCKFGRKGESSLPDSSFCAP